MCVNLIVLLTYIKVAAHLFRQATSRFTREEQLQYERSRKRGCTSAHLPQ
jgi:hypothetical protein